MSETRPLDHEEKMWAEVYGAKLTCDVPECPNEATHNHEIRLAPGVKKLEFRCRACAGEAS